MKASKCKVCRDEYQRLRPMQRVCGIDCARAEAAAKRVKGERKADAEKRLKLKTWREWVSDAQIAFNAYIRARDAGRLCICCSMPLTAGSVGGGYDCGHYRSVGSAPHLRFDERNAHGQRKQCNRYGAGRAVDYRIGLIIRIGREAVESLEADQTPKKYTIEELRQIKSKYSAMARELRKG